MNRCPPRRSHVDSWPIALFALAMALLLTLVLSIPGPGKGSGGPDRPPQAPPGLGL
jgi:hypothetical protein